MSESERERREHIQFMNLALHFLSKWFRHCVRSSKAFVVDSIGLPINPRGYPGLFLCLSIYIHGAVARFAFVFWVLPGCRPSVLVTSDKKSA